MNIDNNTIKHIAKLAMIKIDKEEEQKYAKALEQILTYTEKLDEINLDEIENNQFLTECNKFREDEISEAFNREELLQNALDTQNNMFKIPKTF